MKLFQNSFFLSLLNLPIKRKLLLIILAVILASLAVVLIGITYYEFATYRDGLIKDISEVSFFLVANTAPTLAFNDRKTAQEILDTLQAKPELVIAVLYDANGSTFASYRRSDQRTAALPLNPGIAGIRTAGRTIVSVRPISQKGILMGTLYLRADMASLYSRLFDYAGIVFVVALAFGGGAFMLQVLLQRLISDPLLRLSRMAQRITGGDLSITVPVNSDDEIGQLAKALNHMAGELARSYEELQQNISRLQDANKELEAFSYSVSHDLRAPLRHITGFIELLTKRLGNSLDEKSRHYLKAISDSAGKMGNLIDDLLSFSRTSRAEMAFQMFDTKSLVSEVISEFGIETQGRDVEWNIMNLPSAFGDPRLIKLVWVNLISNALKFTRPLEHAKIEIGSNDEKYSRIFYVKDNGVGIDMKYKNKLFGLFQRLHNSKEFEGTGVGLANVQRIIYRHGGKVWAEGAPGQGATFFFSLKKAKGERT